MTRSTVIALAGVLLVLSLPPSARGQDIDGQILFARYCASCHGPVGEGDGPVANVIESIPNLRNLAARSNGQFPREAVMRYIDGRDLPDAHGERLMPVWGTTFAESDEGSGSDPDRVHRLIEAITDFVASIQN